MIALYLHVVPKCYNAACKLNFVAEALTHLFSLMSTRQRKRFQVTIVANAAHMPPLFPDA